MNTIVITLISKAQLYKEDMYIYILKVKYINKGRVTRLIPELWRLEELEGSSRPN